MENYIFAISGISGSGKTSTMRKVMDNEIVSFTTRSPRSGEIEGVDYIYSDKDHILQLENEGRLVEKVDYRGNIYGITSDELESKLSKGHSFVIVDYHGYEQLKKIHKNTKGIYFKIPANEAKERMVNRGDSIVSVDSRLNDIEKELQNEIYYDFVVENLSDKQSETVQLIKEYINSVLGGVHE